MKQIAALYLRYSGEESKTNSIKNQKENLVNYCNEKNIAIFNLYIDIAKTGTNLNRPEYQNMIHDLKDKRFNIIVVKDLSRLSRNYRDAGTIIEEILTPNKIRLISLNDNFDSFNENDSMDFPIKNYLNTMYSLDIKRKIRKSIEIRANKKKIIKIPKFGYVKNEEGNLSIDETSASIVRQIFSLAFKGLKPTQIAKTLQIEKKYNPNFYKLFFLKVSINKNHEVVLKNPYKWNGVTIVNVLKDYEYCGHTINIKCKNAVNKEKNILIKNTHPAIINEETFKKTPKKFENKKERKTKYLNNFFYCLKCNKVLTLSERINLENNIYYCPNCLVKIKTQTLEDIIYNDLKRIINNVITNKTLIEEKLFKKEKNKKNKLLKEKKQMFNDCSLLFEGKIANQIKNEDFTYKSSLIDSRLNLIEEELLTFNFTELKSNQKTNRIINFIQTLDLEFFDKYSLIKEFIEKTIIEIKDDLVNINIFYKFI